MEVFALVFLLGVGPLALLLGADSREADPRGWWPGGGSRRPGEGSGRTAGGLRAWLPVSYRASRAAASSAFRRANSLQPAGVLASHRSAAASGHAR